MYSDFHNDVLTVDRSALPAVSAKTACTVCAVYRGQRSPEEIFSVAEIFLRKRPDNLYLGFEDIGYACNEEMLEKVCSFRPVYASLTWNEENELAGGCFSEKGLTEAGRRAVKKLTQAGIFLDCAHLNERSFYESIELGARPVDSHTCFSALRTHPRNLDDGRVREIVVRGGLIGITFVEKFLCDGRATAETVFSHVDHALQKFGPDSFCFGSDFYGAERYAKGVENEQELREIFLKHGYSSALTENIFTQNLKSFLSKKVN